MLDGLSMRHLADERAIATDDGVKRVRANSTIVFVFKDGSELSGQFREIRIDDDLLHLEPIGDREYNVRMTDVDQVGVKWHPWGKTFWLVAMIVGGVAIAGAAGSR